MNVSGGRKPQAFGALFGSYARKEMVEQVVFYVTGLTRIQYSAFRGALNANDRAVLARRVNQFVKDEHDSIFIIPLCRTV
jgi:CRISPR-associated endonuclease Cas2